MTVPPRAEYKGRGESVSTRRESADLMGISLPSILLSSSEDNINLGDRDSIRRRALLALEGKDAGGSFSVEIPELDGPEVPKRSSFDFRTCFVHYAFVIPLRQSLASKPSFPPGLGTGYMGGKRDSVKFMASTPFSELLGTLVEEEEEEEEDEEPKEVHPITSPVQLTSPAIPDIAFPPRPRPASLNLRPLSLASAHSLPTTSSTDAELPTPSPTPSPRPGLRSLTLPSS